MANESQLPIFAIFCMPKALLFIYRFGGTNRRSVAWFIGSRTLNNISVTIFAVDNSILSNFDHMFRRDDTIRVLASGTTSQDLSAARSPFNIIVISIISTTFFESGNTLSLATHISKTLSKEPYCHLLISSKLGLQIGIYTLVSAAPR
jgi:hypothetical protein